MIVVIPAYEPDKKLLGVVQNLLDKTVYRIVIVDDGSSAEKQVIFNEIEAMRSDRIKVIHHKVNRGKGRAMKTAFEWIKSLNLEDEGIITVDADGQHLIADIEKVCDTWSQNRSALVLGSRGFTGKVPLRSRLGNGITRFVFAVSTGVRVYDTQTGLRAFSTNLLDEMLDINGDRYEYEMNQLLFCTKKQIPIVEETIETVYINENETSHFNTIKDSWRIYKVIFGFIASSIISWVVDYSLVLILTKVFSIAFGGSSLQLFGFPLEPKLPALIIARIVSSIVNFTLNRRVVFEAKGSALRYYLLAVLILAANYGMLALLTPAIPLWLAQILAQLVLYPLSFVLQRKFVFTRKANEKKQKGN